MTEVSLSLLIFLHLCFSYQPQIDLISNHYTVEPHWVEKKAQLLPFQCTTKTAGTKF